MTLRLTHLHIHSIEQSTHLPVCSDDKKATFPGIQANLTVTSCFQMHHGVMTECNHPMSIEGRRRSCQVRSGDTLRSLRASATCPRQMHWRIRGLAGYGFWAAALIAPARVPDVGGYHG